MAQTETDRQPDAPREGGGQLRKWTKRVLLGLAGLVVFVLLAGLLYQFVATKIDAYRWYPPPSEMVDVGGSSMHLHCTGEEGSAPTVVMDIGAGGNLLDWQLVQPGVAKFARVCTYDRGGAGWSEPGAQPRTSQQFVGELHALLNNAGIEGPYVLVGHSLGGNNAQIYASRYPYEVAGMVLVDPQFYNYPSYLDPEVQNALAEALPSPGSTLWTKFLATIGVTRLPYTFGGQTDENTAINTHAKGTYETMDEYTYLEESAKERSAATVSLGDKPLVVLSAGAREFPGFSQEQSDQINEGWTESQVDLTRVSRNSEQIIAEDSSHNIQYDDPELVIDAIRQVMEAVRNGGNV
jgi:pimeloyl-ACP methyl ester carboxylesterase